MAKNPTAPLTIASVVCVGIVIFCGGALKNHTIGGSDLCG